MIQRYRAYTGEIEPDDDGEFVKLEDIKPVAWFVKDFADDWISFDNEKDALDQVAETGALMIVGYRP